MSKMFLIQIIALLLLNLIVTNDCARILAVVPTPCLSHQLFYRPLWKKLSERHEVVLLTTHPNLYSDNKNLTQIDLHGANKLWTLVEISDKFKHNPSQIRHEAANMMYKIMEYELSHPEVRKLIENKDEHFDLLMVEDLNYDMLAFSVRFNCPYIGVVSLDAHTPRHEIMGNPIHPYLFPAFEVPYAPPLSFWERCNSLYFYLRGKYLQFRLTDEKSNDMIRKHFGEGYPPVSEIAKNISLLFINTNPVFDIIRPLVPNTIEIGGATHINERKLLPEAVQTFLDEATDGVVYLSLGTNFISKHISDSLKSIFSAAMNDLPYKVLWKFEEDVHPMPENTMIIRWCSQQDVLRHPNVRAFITHAGYHSTEEGIIFKVPMVAIPAYQDNSRNAIRITQTGIGLSIDKETITKDILVDAVHEVITNPKYKENIVELSEALLDQPMSGMERAVWWTDYVIRHKGAKYLKIHKIPFVQYYFLDVVITFLVMCLFIFVLIYLAFKIARRIKRERAKAYRRVGSK